MFNAWSVELKPLGPDELAMPLVAAGGGFSEPIAKRYLHRPRRAGHDIVVGVGAWEIMGVQQILDVQLRFDAGRQLIVERGVEARVARGASRHC